MLAQTELNHLAEHKRRLIAECDRERSAIRLHRQVVVSKFHWVDQVREIYHIARPAVWVGASLVGLRAASRLSKAARLLSGAFQLVRRGSSLLFRRRLRLTRAR